MRAPHLLIVTSLFLAAPAAAQVTAVESQALPPHDPAPGTSFGDSSSLSGDRLAVGAPGSAGTGRVFVYERGPEGFEWTATIAPSDGSSGDDFGDSVALEGNVLVVGAPRHDGSGSLSGAVYVYGLSGGTWLELVKLLPVGITGSAVPTLGRHVAISGQTVAATGQVDTGIDGFFVWRQSAGVWTHEGTYDPTTGTPGGWASVSSLQLEGDRLAVGMPYDFNTNGTSTGRAAVYLRSGGAWSLEDAFTASDASGDQAFGWAVALEGDDLIVSAIADADFGANSGSAYRFERQGSEWVEVTEFAPPGLPPGAGFGSRLALQGDVLVAAAENSDLTVQLGGALYVYEDTPGGFVLRETLHPKDLQQNERFSRAISVDGRYLSAGRPSFADGGQWGRCDLYELGIGQGLAFCYGDGSGNACPCGNTGAVGAGCAHSGGVGMLLGVTGGGPSVTDDDLVLTASQCPPGNSGLFYAGSERLLGGVPLYDGLQCAGGDVRRFMPLFQTTGSASDGGFVAQDPSGVYFCAGSSYHFQYWSRDVAQAGGCGTGANFSHGLSLTFRP